MGQIARFWCGSCEYHFWATKTNRANLCISCRKPAQEVAYVELPDMEGGGLASAKAALAASKAQYLIDNPPPPKPKRRRRVR